MANERRNFRGKYWLLAALLAAGIALAVWAKWPSSPGQHEPHTPEVNFSLPPYTASPFRNTRPGIEYTGSAACTECHQANHDSYLLTPHSRALADLDATTEPPDGAFEHALSGRAYRIYRQGNQLRHEEVMRTPEGKEIARLDYPIRFLIGSGHFTRSYLVEADGFLHESPITWYASRQKWDMSPGYDSAQHQGFERPVSIECLSCHAGRAEPLAGTENRYRFLEKAIGCENCHGPGSLHVELQRGKKLAPGAEDDSIVHPGKLSRSLQESLCAACHQSGTATVYVRGRQVSNIRPGLPLSDYRIHYRFDTDDAKMTVVGHIEQLRQSACYQKTQDLTCVTCHNPHQKAKPANLIAFYRDKCLECHGKKPCRLEEAERLKKDKNDNCALCHMPRGDTDIPHIAFTHHRIGKHRDRPHSISKEIPELIPADDVSHLSPLDQKRNLGLARAEIYLNPAHAAYAAVYRERAREELEAVRAAGLRDGEVAANLAELYLARGDVERAAIHAREAMDLKETSPRSRANALVILATIERARNDLQASTRLLEDVVGIRRMTNDWFSLGSNYLDQDEAGKALNAFKRALAIRPYHRPTQLMLADLYGRQGDVARAREHQEKAALLLNRKP